MNGRPHLPSVNAERITNFVKKELFNKINNNKAVKIQKIKGSFDCQIFIPIEVQEKSREYPMPNQSKDAHIDAAIMAIAEICDRPINQTKYIASFRVGDGREVALERNKNSFYLWTGRCADVAPAEFTPFLRRRYSASKSRNSNLNDKNSPTLKTGYAVDYWLFPTVGALSRFVQWYSSI